MEAIFSLIALVGMGFAGFVGLKWMARVGQINARKDHQLTPNDLKILEESTSRLMSDLKTVTNECVAKIECACLEAEQLLKSLETAPRHQAEQSDIAIIQDLPLEIPRETGMTNGELELVKGLIAISK